MKRIVLILICVCFSSSLWAQEEEKSASAFVSEESFRENSKLETRTAQPSPKANTKPQYAGTSVDMGYMFMPHYGSAFYMAPKLMFRATPRLFVNTGVSIVQYSLLPSQMKSESPLQRTATGAYIFAESVYLLNERWSVNGSVMKSVTPAPARKMTPYSVPTEAVHIGVDYKITPSITVGARVGYSNGGRSNMSSPFYPY